MLQRAKRFIKTVGKRTFKSLFRLYEVAPAPVRKRVRLLPALLPLRLQTKIRNHWLAQFPPDDGFRSLYPAAPPVHAPGPNSWAGCKPPNLSGPAKIDVVIPVFRGFDETLNCIHSVLVSSNQTSFEIVVVNDKSPEKPLTDELRKLAHERLITLVENKFNLGFVRSVNRGMRLHRDRDVILLNSDTEVYGDWLDRLYRVASSDPLIASVTPFTTNGTLASYPIFLRDNYMQIEPSYKEIDAIASQSPVDQSIDIPTAVGFCMYIPRRALSALGYFDARRFGKGYGEENDFSRRAASRGWTNVLAPNVFVRHLGETSFQGEKRLRLRRALAQLQKLHPDYPSVVDDHINLNPALPARRAIDIGRMIRPGSKAMLFVRHNLGGGSIRNAQDLEQRLALEGVRTIYMSPDAINPSRVILSTNDIGFTPNATFDMDHDLSELANSLRRLRVFHIHVHQLIGYPDKIKRTIMRISSELDVPYDITLHDYFLICPCVNLIGNLGIYCREESEAPCEHDADSFCDLLQGRTIEDWRTGNGPFLQRARRIFAPSQDVKLRFLRYFPELEISALPHLETHDFHGKPQLNDSKQIDIALIGAIGGHKGLKVVVGCAMDAAQRNLPINFHIIGHLDRTEPLPELDNITETGPYATDLEALDHLTRINPKLCFFPSPWPETYSYTLSLAWAAGCYAVSFNLGAMAERIQESGLGTTINFELVNDYAEINDLFMSLQVPSNLKGFESAFRNNRYESILQDYYGFPAV